MLLEGAQLEAPAAPLNDLLRVGLDAAPDEVAVTSAHRALSWQVRGKDRREVPLLVGVDHAANKLDVPARTTGSWIAPRWVATRAAISPIGCGATTSTRRRNVSHSRSLRIPPDREKAEGSLAPYPT
jgi:hypothetical protein